MRIALLSAALASLFAAPAGAAPALTSKEQVLWSALESRLQGIASRLDGVLGYSVKDLKSGATLELRGDETFPLASSIKLAVLYELYLQAEEGRIDIAQVTKPKAGRVGGGGVLQELGSEVSLTWRDLAVLMMGWSDNEATNVLIDKLGQERVNQRLLGLGLQKTRLRRLMMDVKAARRGDENVGTPAEMRSLVEQLHAGASLSPARAQDLRKVAAVAKSSPFRLPLPEGLVVLDKPGDLEAVRCVTAVVEMPGRPYSVSLMTTYLRRDPDGEAVIREISEALFETFRRLAGGSGHGRMIGTP